MNDITQHAAAPGARSVPYDLAAFLADLGDVPVERDPVAVKRRSRDYFWYSPVLNRQLHGLSADAIVLPRDEADVLAVARAAVRHRVPVTARGAGTGNYGQAVPLAGGIVLDLSGLTAIEWWKPGMIRVGAGAKMVDIDTQLRPQGWEIRMHPSTKRLATIGGFIAGGSGGIGSIGYGGLRDSGNLVAARVVTFEDEPRIVDLRGREVQAVNHAYGTTGIVTAVEMPLAPAWNWIDTVVAFDDFMDAVRFSNDIASADAVVKKLVTPIVWPLPVYFKEIRSACPDGKSIVICMIAEASMETFRLILGDRGTITLERPFDESPASVPLYEYTWNHTTLQALKVDRTVTYLQCLYPHDRLLETIEKMWRLFGDEVMPHLEFVRFSGKVTASSLPVVRYTTDERLNEIIRIYEDNGVFIANPHVYTLEDGTRHKKADIDQLVYKAKFDPHGLLNPGKMRTYVATA